MRSSSRPAGSARKRAVPTRSRLTVRPTASAPLQRDLGLREALRASRDALVDIQNALDALLLSVRAAASTAASGLASTGAGAASAPETALATASAAPPPRAEAIDRLARSARRADAAIRRLSP
jgi:hypothetical protein